MAMVRTRTLLRQHHRTNLNPAATHARSVVAIRSGWWPRSMAQSVSPSALTMLRILWLTTQIQRTAIGMVPLPAVIAVGKGRWRISLQRRRRKKPKPPDESMRRHGRNDAGAGWRVAETVRTRKKPKCRRNNHHERESRHAISELATNGVIRCRVWLALYNSTICAGSCGAGKLHRR